MLSNVTLGEDGAKQQQVSGGEHSPQLYKSQRVSGGEHSPQLYKSQRTSAPGIKLQEPQPAVTVSVTARLPQL